jgi:hypothetical protein
MLAPATADTAAKGKAAEKASMTKACPAPSHALVG